MAEVNPKELKLKAELVPKASWFKNLRAYVPAGDWELLRQETYARYGNKCGICSAEGRLNCHEVWEYDENTQVQHLTGLIALCDMCHHVKHIGMAGVLATQGKLDYQRVVEHFMKVNDCDNAAFDNHMKQVFVQWEIRSSYKWKIDFGKYKELVKNCPE